MNDLISRQAALNAIEKTIKVNSSIHYEMRYWEDGMNCAKNILEDLPSAQPERKKGKWEFVGLQMFVCSECKHGFRQDWLMDWRTHNSEPIFPNFCPNCGAEMEQ